MQIIYNILIAALAGFLIWRTYQVIRQNPSLLSKANVSQSLRTAGLLALGLIAFVSLLVLMVRI